MTTRDDVRDWIAEHPGSTSEEVAKGLKLTTNYVRWLIRRLAVEGEIEGVKGEPCMGRAGGVPPMLWRVVA